MKRNMDKIFMKITLLLVCIITTVSAFSQEIVGKWELQKVDPIVKTNNEEVTQAILEIINDSLIDRMITSLQLTEDGKVITEGGEGYYFIENGYIMFKSKHDEDEGKMEYSVKENELILTFDIRFDISNVKSFSSNMYAHFSEDYPKLEIKEIKLKMTFSKPKILK